MTDSAVGSYQVVEELKHARGAVEEAWKSSVEGLNAEEEKLVGMVREKMNELRKAAEAWKSDSIKFLDHLISSFEGNTTPKGHLEERLMSNFDDLRASLDHACKLTLPVADKISLEALNFSAKPLSVRLDEELPSTSFWSHKLYLLSADLTSIQVINLVRLEITRVPLPPQPKLIANSVWTVLSSGHIFVCGGGHFGIAAKDCFIIDLKTYEVREIAKMNNARTNPGVVEHEGKVLVFGGESGLWQDQKISSCEEYDLATNSWNNLADMSLPKGYLSPVLYKSRILLSGGEVNQIEAYLPHENRFDSFYAGYMDQVLMAASFADEEYFYTLRKNKLYVHQFNSDFDQFPEVKMAEIPYNIWMTRTQPVRLGQKFYIAVRDELWSFDTIHLTLHKELTLT